MKTRCLLIVLACLGLAVPAAAQSSPGNPLSGLECLKETRAISPAAPFTIIQAEPHKAWAALPAGPQRLPFTEHHLLAGGKSPRDEKHAGGAVRTQELRGEVAGDKFLMFKPAEGKGWLELRFATEKEQVVDLVGNLVHGRECGKYRALLDGQELELLNLYAEDLTPTPHRWGMRQLAAGDHVLRFESTGKPGAGDGYSLAFDTLIARVPVYARPLDLDLRTIQK